MNDANKRGCAQDSKNSKGTDEDDDDVEEARQAAKSSKRQLVSFMSCWVVKETQNNDDNGYIDY